MSKTTVKEKPTRAIPAASLVLLTSACPYGAVEAVMSSALCLGFTFFHTRAWRKCPIKGAGARLIVPHITYLATKRKYGEKESIYRAGKKK